jgi:hypothetical protein
MADVKPQIPNKAKEAKAAAQAATSVPQLREAVVDNSEAIEQLQALVAKLQKKVGR